MRDLKTTFATFSAVDYKNTDSLSSYSLQETPLTFIANVPPNSNYKLVWSFGDGDRSSDFSPTKYYNFPGEYTVSLIVYDCSNNAQISSFSKTITVYNFVDYSMSFTNLSGNSPELNIIECNISGPWVLNATYPHYQPVSNILYTYDGSNSTNYFNISSERFAHLEKTYSVFQSVSNVGLSALQYVEVPSISPENRVDLYARINEDIIEYASSEDVDAFFVGVSSATDIYFKDDTVGDTSLDFKFDHDNSYIPTNVKYLNSLSVSLSLSVIENDDYDHGSLTSNGLDGEGTPITSFEISPIKFYGHQIPFVYRVKSSDNFSIKNLSAYGDDSIQFSLLSGGSTSDIPFTITQLVSASYPTSYVGLLSVQNQETPATLQLSAYDDVVGIEVESSEFTIFPHGYYDIFKVNENFNAQQVLEDITLQDTIKNNPTLYEFFGSLLGDDILDHDNIGTKIYERIANFVANNADIDVDDINALISQLELLQADELKFDRGLFNYPEKIRRILNLCSVDYNKLVGTTNKFRENFDIAGHASKDVFGTNIGDQLDTNTYILSAGTDIVALEKFSGDYTLLNSYQPLGGASYENVIQAIDSTLSQTICASGINIYSSGYGTPYAPRNPNCPLNSFRGIEAMTNGQFGGWNGVAITPRHIITYAHQSGGIPDVSSWKFYDPDGVLVVATSLSSVPVQGAYDTLVFLLNADLPSNIRPIRMLSYESAEYLQTVGGGVHIPLIGRSQDMNMSVRDLNQVVSIAQTWNGSIPVDPTRLEYYQSMYIGDSGNMHCILQDNELLGFGGTTGGGAGSGPVYSYELDATQDAINALNTAFGVVGTYEIGIVDLSTTTKALALYNSDWGWPLVLPNDFNTVDFDKYYTFFEYTSGYDNTIVDNLIDFTNEYTTISAVSATKDNLFSDAGYFDHLLLDTLYSVLSV